MRLPGLGRHRLTRLGAPAEGEAAEASEAFYAARPHPPSALQRMLIAAARNSFLHRGKFRHLMTRLIILLGGNRPLDVQFRGCSYRIAGRRNLVEYGILLNPNYNRPDLDFLLAGLPEGGVAIDIGANIGLYSLPLGRAAGATGRVIAIDANPLMIRALSWNAAASAIRNISLHATAVGAQEGRAELYFRQGDVAIVSVAEAAEGSIPVRSLKSIADEERLERVDVLKIDIEGYEDKALVPYLEQCDGAMLPQRIVIEHLKGVDYPGCKAAFDRLGYRLVGRTKQNSLYQRG